MTYPFKEQVNRGFSLGSIIQKVKSKFLKRIIVLGKYTELKNAIYQDILRTIETQKFISMEEFNKIFKNNLEKF